MSGTTVYITQGTRSKMQGVAFRLTMTLLWFFAHPDSFVVTDTTPIVSWKWNQQVIFLKSLLWSLLNLGERSAFWGKTCFTEASSFKLKAWNYLKKKERKKEREKKKSNAREKHILLLSIPVCHLFVISKYSLATHMEGRKFMLLCNKNSCNNDD